MTDLLERLRRVEPDKPGVRTRWYRNPDGPEAADEIERLRLTDAEREAIEWFAEVRKPLSSFDDGEYVFTLRKLFERLGGEQ